MGEGVWEESRGVTRAPTFLACTAGLMGGDIHRGRSIGGGAGLEEDGG